MGSYLHGSKLTLETVAVFYLVRFSVSSPHLPEFGRAGITLKN